MEESKMHSGVRMLRGVYIATEMTSSCHLGIVFRILNVLQGKGKIFLKMPSEASDKKSVAYGFGSYPPNLVLFFENLIIRTYFALISN